MTRITPLQFRETFGPGIDIRNSSLQRALREVGLSNDDITALDEDQDGIISGQELQGLYALLDALDPEDNDPDLPWMLSMLPAAAREVIVGSVELGNQMELVPGEPPPMDHSADTKLYHALVESIVDPAARTIAVARSMQMDPRLEFGYRGSETTLSPNRMHGGRRREDGLIQTRYVGGDYTCNIFVGDVLYRAGFVPPSHHGGGTNGEGPWEHYVGAEKWWQSPHLTRVSREEMRPGDILVIDNRRSAGSGGGHLEIVTEIEHDEGGSPTRVVSMGARWANNGIVEDEERASMLLEAVKKDDGKRGLRYHFESEIDDRELFILRPRPTRAMLLSSTIRG